MEKKPEDEDRAGLSVEEYEQWKRGVDQTWDSSASEDEARDKASPFVS